MRILEDRCTAIVDGYAIDDIKWVAPCIDRAQATDAHGGDTTRLTRIGAYCYPSNSPRELVFEGDGGDVLHILRGDRCCRSCEGGLTRVAIPRDDDVLDDLFFGLEDDLHLSRSDGDL